MAEWDEDEDAAAAYAAKLARVILTASDALRSGDVGYASRVIHLFAEKIRRGLDKARAEQDARQTRH